LNYDLVVWVDPIQDKRGSTPAMDDDTDLLFDLPSLPWPAPEGCSVFNVSARRSLTPWLGWVV
jgi:hypothetical protein